MHLDHAFLAGELCSVGRHTVQQILNRNLKGQGLKRRAGLSLKIEVRGRALAEREADGVAADFGLHTVRQIFDAVIGSVIHNLGRAVQCITFHNGGIGRVAVAVESHIIGLVDGRMHAACDFGLCSDGEIERKTCAEDEGCELSAALAERFSPRCSVAVHTARLLCSFCVVLYITAGICTGNGHSALNRLVSIKITKIIIAR